MQPPACVTVKDWPAIVRVAVRAWPVLAAAEKVAVPLPVPPAVTVSQEALLAGVHAHPAPVVTVTLPVPPPAGTLPLPGAIAKEQPLPWFSVKVWPPIVSAPDRGAPELAATLYCTVPLPVPLAPDVIVSQGALLAAVHEQPSPALTVTLPVPPLTGAFPLVDPIEMEQPLP